MRGKFKSALVINFLIIVFASISSANQCSFILSDASNKKLLRIAAYNLEKFFIRTPNTIVNSPATVFKSQRHVRGNIEAVNTIAPDIWLATEVVGEESLKTLAETYLEGRYDYVSVKGNNSNNYMTLFFKKDLNLKVEVLSHADQKVINPLTHREEPAFIQDFPIFFIHSEDSLEPDFAIAGVHFKSERDRALDKSSYFKRMQEADLATEIVKDFKTAYPNVPLMVMGDFNTSSGSLELNGFSKDLKFVDPFRYDFEDPHKMNTYTHSYHDDNGSTVYSSPDRVFLDPLIAKNVIKARVYRYRDSNGNIRPLPRSFEERGKNPSDHYPIYFDIKM